MYDEKIKLVPPDGKWGWVVCFAYILCNMLVHPITSGFGLIFQEYFEDLKLSATDVTAIITLHFVFGLIFSLFKDVLLERFGYRKMAVFGGIFVFFGILLTSLAKNTKHFIVTYSLITSIGTTMITSSYSVAVNSYFEQKRFLVKNITMLFIGIGFIGMPLYTDLMMQNFGKIGTIQILSAICMHSMVAAVLLRPVKWYLKKPKVKTNSNDNNKTDYFWRLLKFEDDKASNVYLSEDEDDYLDIEMNDESSEKSSILELKDFKKKTCQKSNSSPALNNRKQDDFTNKRSISLLSDINSKISTEALMELKFELLNESVKRSESNTESDNCGKVDFLCDPIFMNIISGVSITMSSQMIFEQLTPFILKDFRFSTTQIAITMSVIATADTIFRFASPFIGDWCKKSARVMYLLGSLMFVLTRTAILLARTYQAMILVAVGLGIAKGLTTIYVSQILPDYIPSDKFKFASNFETIQKIIIIIIVGPILGIIRERLGSPEASIIILNVITSVTIITWSVEYFYAARIINKGSITTRFHVNTNKNSNKNYLI